MTTIKAISLYQPWASLVAHGYKRIETRSWGTAFRGTLAIHAAKKCNQGLFSLCGVEPFNICLEAAGYPLGRDLPLGAVVAVADLVKVYQIGINTPGKYLIQSVRGEDSQACWEENSFGDYTIGRYGWVLNNIRLLPEPIPARGRQGLWNWEYPPAVADIIREINDGQFTNAIS